MGMGGVLHASGDAVCLLNQEEDGEDESRPESLKPVKKEKAKKQGRSCPERNHAFPFPFPFPPPMPQGYSGGPVSNKTRGFKASKNKPVNLQFYSQPHGGVSGVFILNFQTAGSQANLLNFDFF